MALATQISAGLLFAFLVLVAPLRGRGRYERFRREVASDPTARLRYYRSSLTRKYALTLVAIALYFANDREGYGVRLIAAGGSHYGEVVSLLAGVALGAVLVRWRLARPSRRAKLARAIRRWADLLPRTATERRTWVAVSISAGITEEILYRAFVLSVLANVLPDADATTIVLTAAAVFGLAHLYQGLKGVLLTALLGAVLGAVVLSSGLLLAMAVHALIDLRLLIIPPDVVAEAGRHDLEEG
jgi:uncharacterized protein